MLRTCCLCDDFNGLYVIDPFPRLKARMIRLHEDKFYYQNLDEVWRVGILGAVYDNPSDPIEP